MASETTFDHWKVFFSWGKVRKRALTQNSLVARFSNFLWWLVSNLPKNGTNLRPGEFFWVFSLLSQCVSDLATWSHLLHGFLCAFSMWRRLTILNLVLEVALFALKTNLVFFLYVVPHFLPCFPVNSHREHCTRGIIFASGHVLPFFAKRTEEARGRWDFCSELLEEAVSWTGFSPIVAIRDSKSSIWKLYWSN